VKKNGIHKINIRVLFPTPARIEKKLLNIQKKRNLVVNPLVKSNHPLAKPIVLHRLNLLLMCLPICASNSSSKQLLHLNIHTHIRALSRTSKAHHRLKVRKLRHTAWRRQAWEIDNRVTRTLGAVESLVEKAVAVGIRADGLDGLRAHPCDDAAVIGGCPLAVSGEVWARASVDGARKASASKIG
jgi:hypothetical protein